MENQRCGPLTHLPEWAPLAGFQYNVARGSIFGYLMSSEEVRPIAAAREDFSICLKVDMML